MTQTLFGRRRRKKKRQKERKDKFLSKVMLSECKQWQGDVCWLMTFQHGDKCMRKREVYGWAEIFKFAGNIVGDAHSGLPWTVMYVEVKAAMFSVYPCERKNTIRDVRRVRNKRCKNGLRPNRKYFILLESEIHELLIQTHRRAGRET